MWRLLSVFSHLSGSGGHGRSTDTRVFKFCYSVIQCIGSGSASFLGFWPKNPLLSGTLPLHIANPSVSSGWLLNGINLRIQVKSLFGKRNCKNWSKWSEINSVQCWWSDSNVYRTGPWEKSGPALSKTKDCLTVQIGHTNATGTHKLKPVLTGKLWEAKLHQLCLENLECPFYHL